jgi:hypothetical protein
MKVIHERSWIFIREVPNCRNFNIMHLRLVSSVQPLLESCESLHHPLEKAKKTCYNQNGTIYKKQVLLPRYSKRERNNQFTSFISISRSALNVSSHVILMTSSLKPIHRSKLFKV